MKMADTAVAAFGVASIRERMGTQTAHGSVVDDHLDILDEVCGRLAAMPVNFREVVTANHCQDLLDLADGKPVHTFAVNHCPICIDLNE